MSFITSYGRKFGITFMLVIPVFIIILMTLSGFDPNHWLNNLIIILWFFLFINSITVSISGYSLASNFNKEVKRLHEKGFPIRSMVGFQNMYNRIRNIFASAFFISIIVLISLLTYASITSLDDFITRFSIPIEDLPFLMMLVALSLIFIAIGISLIISLPDAPALVPGSLMKYYIPVAIPSQLDNILSDSIFPFLDPITRSRWDEFSEFISDNIDPSFEPNEDPVTKLEIAREKILLFAYLNHTMPLKISIEETKRELGELFISADIVDKLMAGEKSGITWDVLMEIIRRIEKKAPEIFQIVDRIIVQLTENLKAFKTEKLYVTVTAPSRVSGDRYPFRILVFMLNKDILFADKKRPVSVKLITDQQGRFPDSYELYLDEAEVVIESDFLPLIGDGEDVVGVLSRILQVGDAIWFQEYRREIRYHLFNIRVAEAGKGSLFGISIDVKLIRDIPYIVTKYGGKIFAIGGAALPIIGYLALRGGFL